jgi:hypothetical protein
MSDFDWNLKPCTTPEGYLIFEVRAQSGLLGARRVYRNKIEYTMFILLESD